MQIDLNDPYTSADVADLIVSKDDSQNRQLKVAHEGSSILSDVTGAKVSNKYAFVMETWGAGNDYVGAAAAEDTEWVGRIEKVLWEN